MLRYICDFIFVTSPSVELTFLQNFPGGGRNAQELNCRQAEVTAK